MCQFTCNSHKRIDFCWPYGNFHRYKNSINGVQLICISDLFDILITLFS